MPQSWDMGQIILLPLRRKACCGFFAWKIRLLRSGANPEASMQTPGPPKPLYSVLNLGCPICNVHLTNVLCYIVFPSLFGPSFASCKYSGPLSYDRLDIRTTRITTEILVLTYDQILSYGPHAGQGHLSYAPHGVRKLQSEPRYACLWT
jgi:hypothetical protein